MINVADLEAWLGSPSESGVATLLTSLETRAVEILEHETERYFGASTTHTEILVGDGTSRLRIRERPASITSVEYRTRPGESWTAITEGATDGWELHLPRGGVAGGVLLRTNGYAWTSGYEFRVIYDFGYTAGQEPGDIRQAVLDIVSFLYHERGREGLRGETVGDYSYSVMAEATGKRSMLTAVPGLASTVNRWRGQVYA